MNVCVKKAEVILFIKIKPRTHIGSFTSNGGRISRWGRNG